MATWTRGPRTAFAALAVVASLGLASCTAGTTASPQASDSATSTESLNLLITDNGTEWVGAFKAAGEAFTAKTGVKVNVEAHPSDDYDKIIDTRLQGGGDGPDVFVVRPARIPDYVAEGYLSPLEGESWFTALPQGAQNAPNSVQDGKHFAFPIAKNPNYMVYNKDLFDKAGVTVPTTLSELKAASQKLLDAGITPIAMSAKDNWWPQFILFHATAQHVLNVSPDNGQKIMSGTETFAQSAGWQETLDVYKDLEPYYMKNPLGTSFDAAKAAFLQGKAAMFPAPWILPDVRKTQLNVGAMVFPTTEDPTTPAIWGDYPVLLGVNPKGGAETTAKQFSEFLLSDDAYPALVKGLKYFPVKDGVDVSSVDPLFAEVQQIVKGREYYGAPNDVWLPGVQDVFLAQVTDLLAGKATVAQVLDKTDAAVKKAQ